MRVVLTVTRVAIGWRHRARRVPRYMTGVAIQIPVGASQRVFSLGVVIKAPFFPAN